MGAKYQQASKSYILGGIAGRREAHMEPTVRGEVTQLLFSWRGGEYKLQLADEMDVGVKTPTDSVWLNDALEELASIDPRKAKVVEMRFFRGLSVEERAEALDVSRITVLRDWRMARAWLRSALSKRAAHG
jgi:RNA polymerase sigma factor (sigma-70 family)